MGIGIDGQADGSGGTHVGGAADGAAEGFLEDAGDGGEFGTAAGDVESFQDAIWVSGKEFLDYAGGAFDQRAAEFVVRGDGDGHFAPSFADAFEIGDDAAGVGVEGFLAFPALFEEAEGFGIGERIALGGAAGGFESEGGEDFVEVVAAEIGEANAGFNDMRVVSEVDERGVEGAAAQIVDEQGAAGSAFLIGAFAMAELDAGGGGLIEHAEDLKAGGAEGFGGEEALVVVGVGWYADHDFEGLGAVERKSGGLAELAAEGGEKANGEFHERDRLAGDFEKCGWAGVLEEAFEGAENGPAALALDGPGAPAEEAFGTADGDQGREPVAGFAIGGFEADEGVIAAVGGSGDDSSGAEIDSQFHGVVL
jgi:hypothetical protein